MSIPYALSFSVPTATIAQILFAFARIVLLAFIVVLSYTRIPKEHFRTFTLFACTCLLPWDLLLIVWRLLAIAKANGCAVTALVEYLFAELSYMNAENLSSQ